MYLTGGKKREPCAALPPGWIRESSRRERGVSVGKLDVYYWAPSGKKVRSKNELMKEIGDAMDLSNFDYVTGKFNASLIKTNRGKNSKRDKNSEKLQPRVNANLNNLIPPIRQTASIFKQPVTVFKTHKTDVKKNLKADKEKPCQLLWAKRLNNISPQHEGEEGFTMDLPSIVQRLSCYGEEESTASVLASLSTALHLDRKPVLGQKKVENKETNPIISLNTEQPLVAEMKVTDQQIRDQEERVLSARNKLAEAMRQLGVVNC